MFNIHLTASQTQNLETIEFDLNTQFERIQYDAERENTNHSSYTTFVQSTDQTENWRRIY